MLTVAVIILGSVFVMTESTQNFDVRLINPFRNSSKEGRLEIYYSGVWGTVCDDYFTDLSARVVCASLGYGYVGRELGNRYGSGLGQIWLDNVRCNGTEIGIHQCPHNDWGVNDCSHDEDVSISCGNSDTTTMSTRATTILPSTTWPRTTTTWPTTTTTKKTTTTTDPPTTTTPKSTTTPPASTLSSAAATTPLTTDTKCNCPPCPICHGQQNCTKDTCSLETNNTEIYDECVVKAELYVKWDSCCHSGLLCGVVVTLRNDSRWLIHDPHCDDNKCEMAAVDASRMSRDWKLFADKKITISGVGDYVQAGNIANANMTDCSESCKRMMSLS